MCALQGKLIDIHETFFIQKYIYWFVLHSLELVLSSELFVGGVARFAV